MFDGVQPRPVCRRLRLGAARPGRFDAHPVSSLVGRLLCLENTQDWKCCPTTPGGAMGGDECLAFDGAGVQPNMLGQNRARSRARSSVREIADHFDGLSVCFSNSTLWSVHVPYRMTNIASGWRFPQWKRHVGGLDVRRGCRRTGAAQVSRRTPARRLQDLRRLPECPGTPAPS